MMPPATKLIYRHVQQSGTKMHADYHEAAAVALVLLHPAGNALRTACIYERPLWFSDRFPWLDGCGGTL